MVGGMGCPTSSNSGFCAPLTCCVGRGVAIACLADMESWALASDLWWHLLLSAHDGEPALAGGMIS